MCIRDRCYLQVKLCDPRLSALYVPWCEKALYKYSSFPFLSETTLYRLGSCSFVNTRKHPRTACSVDYMSDSLNVEVKAAWRRNIDNCNWCACQNNREPACLVTSRPGTHTQVTQQLQRRRWIIIDKDRDANARADKNKRRRLELTATFRF